MNTIEGVPVDISPLKNALVDYFALCLKYLGGAAMAHRLISPESAHGLLSYAEPLASIALVWAGHTITKLRIDGLQKEIQFLKSTFNHATALANSKLAQAFAEQSNPTEIKIPHENPSVPVVLNPTLRSSPI